MPPSPPRFVPPGDGAARAVPVGAGGLGDGCGVGAEGVVFSLSGCGRSGRAAGSFATGAPESGFGGFFSAAGPSGSASRGSSPLTAQIVTPPEAARQVATSAAAV